MNEQENRQYLQILMDELDVGPVRRFLEDYFTEDERDYYKQSAVDCVRIKNDIDRRMREHRETAEDCESD